MSITRGPLPHIVSASRWWCSPLQGCCSHKKTPPPPRQPSLHVTYCFGHPRAAVYSVVCRGQGISRAEPWVAQYCPKQDLDTCSSPRVAVLTQPPNLLVRVRQQASLGACYRISNRTTAVFIRPVSTTGGVTSSRAVQHTLFRPVSSMPTVDSPASAVLLHQEQPHNPIEPAVAPPAIS